jgi:uncharacterized membrane protein YbhN (UPF0104 family)
MPSERLARRTVAFYVLTSSVNFFTAVIAGIALALAGGFAPLWTVGPALAAGLVIGTVLALPRVAARPRAGRRGQVLTALGAGIGDAVRLVRTGHPLILAGAIGFMAFDLLALGAAFAALGALPPLGVLAMAYVLGQLGGLIPLPGGVGGADGGLIAALALYGTPLGTAAAAVLAYRAFQLGLPALLGALAVVRLPRVLEHAPNVGALCEPLARERAPGVGRRYEPRARAGAGRRRAVRAARAQAGAGRRRAARTARAQAGARRRRAARAARRSGCLTRALGV